MTIPSTHMNWVMIVAIGLLVIVGLELVKFEHHAKRIKIILLVFLGLFIYFSVVTVFSSGNVDLSSPKGVLNAVGTYFTWIGTTTVNLWHAGVNTVHTVGNAVKVDNSTRTNR